MFCQVTEVLEVWASFAKFQKFCQVLEVSPVLEFCTNGETSFASFRSFAKNLVSVSPETLTRIVNFSIFTVYCRLQYSPIYNTFQKKATFFVNFKNIIKLKLILILSIKVCHMIFEHSRLNTFRKVRMVIERLTFIYFIYFI
jgi:hypothetical protein